MLLLRRLSALFLSVSLLLAQSQGAIAAVHVAAPVKTVGTAGSAAMVGGLAGIRLIENTGASLKLGPSFTSALPSIGAGPLLLRNPQAGSPATAALPVTPALLSRVAAQAGTKALSLSTRRQDEAREQRGSLAALKSIAVLGRSGIAATDPASKSRISRMAVLFDGGALKNGEDHTGASPVLGRRTTLGRLSGLHAPDRRARIGRSGALGIKASSPGKKSLSRWRMLKENRFLIAAAAGAALGFAGVNLGTLPVLSHMPGLFFGVLPWLAAPFIGLNVYKSFAHYGVIKESRTLLGFLVITVAGLAISAGVTIAMTSLLPVVDPASFAAAAIPGLADGGFSPMQFMLPIIGVFTLAALIYKRARGVNDGSARREYPPGLKGSLLRIFDRAVGLIINGRTAPFLEKAGKIGEKGTELINKVFPRFIDIVGIPAIATLLSMSMATGGLALLSSFGGYYITAFAGMAVGMLALLAAYFAFGARAKDFKEILKAALVGFSLSSSSATMPTEKEALKAMGVSKKTRNTVVPLGGVFNMFGTALYMGLTAFYALSMFGAAPTMAQYFSTALAVVVIAMGAPGIPASNITLLEPVLRQTGLESGQITKVYTMILPGDRILDMAQTALNVLGDMLPAVEQDRKRLRYVRVKRIREIRRRRAEEERKRPPRP